MRVHMIDVDSDTPGKVIDQARLIANKRYYHQQDKDLFMEGVMYVLKKIPFKQKYYDNKV